ncbi:hypothetical protein NUW58_g4245 [Xylaria curta]|uniref:Uncharacterized protein n=1 Tax=Xylaria curta TaxID=42375 RepID=A0ACC1P7N7_9PEZI|nr:hypothetical protein NUW58_g4245 [Xylaria curta]
MPGIFGTLSPNAIADLPPGYVVDPDNKANTPVQPSPALQDPRISHTKRMLFISVQILLLAQAAGAFRVPPFGHDTPLCSARSEAPSMFSIKNIKYSLRDPPTTALFQLDVTNPATNYTTKCNLDGPQLAPGPPGKDSVADMWTPCENRTVAPGEERYYTVDTDVLFERKSRLLVINQTWIAFKGTAQARLVNLRCTNSTSSRTTEDCTAPDMSLAIYQYWRDDLPPDALENPIPTVSSTG